MPVKCDFQAAQKCRYDSRYDSLFIELFEIFYVQSLNLKPLDLKRKKSFYITSPFIQKRGLKIVF